MEINEFSDILSSYLEKIEIELNKEQVKKLYLYMELLIEWNDKMNLTAIIEPKEIILKHFVDSLTIAKYIKDEAKVIDIGTGAGFPGIPLKIYRPDLKITLLDSLNKRLKFLDEVINELKLSDIETIHSRAEELGKNFEYREKFDVATSRAVANLSTLSEYLLPFVKIKGNCICMKSTNIEDEIEHAKKAIDILGGRIVENVTFNLPESDLNRRLIIFEKVKNTPKNFPRKPGIPAKKPIL